MARKGITPIIAVIVLLLITVSMAGLAYTFLFGVLLGQIEQSFIISPGGVFCDSVGSNGNQITIVIRNTGTTAALAGEDFLVRTVTDKDGVEREIPLADFEIIEAQDTKAIRTYCGAQGAGGCSSGINRIRISTGATSENEIVRCP